MRQHGGTKSWRVPVVALAAAAMAAVPAPAGAAAAPVIGGHARDYSWDYVADLLVRDAATGDLLVHAHSGTYQGTRTYLSPELVGEDWGDRRWIGAGRFSRLSWQTGLADLVSVTRGGELLLTTHTRSYPGLDTFSEPAVLSTGWNINDLLFTYDFNADSYEDIVARRAGTGDMYVYLHNRIDNFGAPMRVSQGGQADEWQALTDVTGDDVADVLFLRDGVLRVRSLTGDLTFTLSTGWAGTTALVLADVDGDRRTDLVGRGADGALRAYRRTGDWNPQPDGTAYDTYLPPEVIGQGWNRYDWLS